MGSTEADEQYATARTSVWWDIENCQVPNGFDAVGIAQNISSALSKMNYSGPVSISAYGDTNRIPSSVQQALSSTGVALNHVPSGVKDASDKKILVDMLFWAVDNPAPANFMLISGDRDFSNALHQLRLRRYNILLAQPQMASAPLVAAAKTVWLWTSLASGGPPRTCGGSSRVLVDGCSPSDPETAKHTASVRVQSQAKGSDSEGGRIGPCENRGDDIPKASNRPVQHQTKRNKVPSNTSTSDSFMVCKLCKVVCHSLEHFTAHLSGKRHTAQAASVSSGGGGPSISSTRAQVGVSTKPVKKPNLVKPVWCKICQISCNSKIVYANHVQGQKHQMNLGKPKNTSTGPTECLDEDVIKKKKKLIKGGAEADAIRVCVLCKVVCDNQIAFESHLKGQRHAANVEKQGESTKLDMMPLEQGIFDVETIQEERIREKDQPSEVIEELQFQPQEEQENIKCLEKQSEEPAERFATEVSGCIEELVERQDTQLPSAECSFNDLSHEYPVPEVVREMVGEGIKKMELSGDVNMMEKLEEELGTKAVEAPNGVCRIS